MKYTIILPKSFQKELDNLPNVIINSVLRNIKELENNPYPRGSKKLAGRDGWRIRIGDYRVLYDVDKKMKIVYLRKVAHRRDIYR